MKIIVTTSDNYHHLLPIFCFLFNRNWGSWQQVEIVGYKKPDFELPSNFTFHSLGTQSGDKRDFSNDLKPYFEKQGQWFIWMFEDTFIKEANIDRVIMSYGLTASNVGRINLSNETLKQDHTLISEGIAENTQTARYRLSTQPSIWNKDFLLQYLKPNLSPWDFETQDSVNDGWRILGLVGGAIKHNEGVTRHDIRKYNFDGVKEGQIEEMKKLGII